MADYKVNAKTDILEFKRKHNLLVENGTVKITTSNIKSLSNNELESLRCGDIVLKEDSSGKHAYLVSFRNNTGICLTYVDASVVETQSYDRVFGVWVYNSEDKTDILNPHLENIKDKDGHLRFVEGDGSSNAKITDAYCKWSLSGTHLLLVLAGNIANGTTIENGEQFCSFVLPSYIIDKIYAVWSNALEYKVIDARANDWSTQQMGVALTLDKSNNTLYVVRIGADTLLTADRSIRIPFDLLIDAE